MPQSQIESKETYSFNAGNSYFLPASITSNPRQIRKIVGCFKKDSHTFSNPDLNVTKQELELFLREVARKQITSRETIDQKFRELIKRIKGNQIRIPHQFIFEKIKTGKRLSSILAYFTHCSIYGRENVEESDLKAFLTEFPDPYAFQFEANCFLDMIETHNSPQKRSEYQDAMISFMKIVYGKQFEYLMQINLLRRKAQQVYFKQIYREELDSLSIQAIDAQQSEAILAQTEIHGSPIENRCLTGDILQENGLQPKYNVRLLDTNIAYFSSFYKIPQGRIAITAYVRKKGKYIPRSYYFSHSHGIWRYLEGYTMVEENLLSYGTGNKRACTNLSLVFQKALAITSNLDGPVKDVPDAHFMFLGTAYNSVSRLYRGSTYYTEVKKTSQKLHGNFYSESSRMLDPETIIFYDPTQAPDLSKFITQWEAKSEVYGQIHYEVYLSYDDKLIYTFCSDNQGRKWLGNIENHSAISPMGIRKVWVDGGDLTIPAAEYSGKSDSYGNSDWKHGIYIDMFKNFLSKIPIFQ